MIVVCLAVIFMWSVSASASSDADLVAPYQMFIPDSLMGFRMKPNIRITSPEGNPPIVYETNSMGYRDREFKFDKPTILVFGTSRTFGTGISVHERWTDMLHAGQSKFNVYNLAIQNTSTEEILFQIRFEEERLIAKANLVLYELQPIVPDGNACRLFDSHQWGRPKLMLRRKGRELEALPIKLTEHGYFAEDQPNDFMLDVVFGTHPTNLFSSAYLKTRCTIYYTFFKREYWRLVRALLAEMESIPRRHGVPVIFFTGEPEVQQLLKAMGYKVYRQSIKHRSRYFVNQRVKHLNKAGNEIILNQVQDFLVKSGYLP